VSYSEVVCLTLSEYVNYLDTTGISDFLIVFFLIQEYCDNFLPHIYAAGNRSERNRMLNFPCLEFFVLLPNGFHISACVARIPWKVKSFILGVAYLFTCTLLISRFRFFCSRVLSTILRITFQARCKFRNNSVQKSRILGNISAFNNAL
jgi:hypothetical protein